MKDAQQLHRFPYRWNEGIISVLNFPSFLLGQNLSSPHSVVWQPVHLHHICSSHFLTEVNIGNNSVNSKLRTAFFLSEQQKLGTIFIYLFIFPHCPIVCLNKFYSPYNRVKSLKHKEKKESIGDMLHYILLLVLLS